jgi:hypothetical protein
MHHVDLSSHPFLSFFYIALKCILTPSEPMHQNSEGYLLYRCCPSKAIQPCHKLFIHRILNSIPFCESGIEVSLSLLL